MRDDWIKLDIAPMSVFRTFDCGQCFRFESTAAKDFEYEVSGIAFGRCVSFAEDKCGSVYVKSNEADVRDIWNVFLDSDTDYNAVNESILSSPLTCGKEHMARAVSLSEGIRILRQDKWETLVSFIISQNNNIPRIKKIIFAMCEKFGERIEGGYAFPTPKALVDAGEDAIFDLKTGFRAKYIYDAAKKVVNGDVSFDEISAAEKYEEAEKLLLGIKGVGPKVAACTLLFGFGRYDAFPIDVWIKKVLAKYYTEGFDPASFGKYAGIAQQYLFYSERYIMN